jgi:outer membrane protein, multidrug efflux system
MKRLFLLAASTGLAACTVGPNYQQPMIATPAAFQEIPAADQAPLSPPSSSEADVSQWWRQFQDPELQKLIDQALGANLDLMSAASRIAQAREQETIQGAAGLPTVNATGDIVRIHSNSNPFAQFAGGGMGSSGSGSGMGSGAAPAPSSRGTNIKLYSLGFDATWEIDVFGGVRRSVESAGAKTEAALWQLRDGEVSLSAEVANDYLTLRTAQSRIAIIRAEAQRQQDTLTLTRDRARTGFITELDVNQQAEQAAETEAQLPPLEAQESAMIHALGILSGKEPEALTAELQPAAVLPPLPPALPAGLPSDLLRRRADVREAERNLAAATAQIGVAIAQYYPKFNLIGLASFASTSVGQLFNSKNFTDGGIGLITWPIFTAGKIGANVKTDEELRNQAYFAYQQAVLKALQDVEDALARYTTEQRRFVSLQQAVAAANSSYTIAQQQYRAGLVTFINVLTTQATLLKDQDDLAQSQSTLTTDLVSLYKALGGGWSDTTPTRGSS